MTVPDDHRVLALVTVPPTLEELLIDLLLAHEATSAFTSVAAHGHGADHDLLSLPEQVSGRRKQVQFHVELKETAASELLTSLQEAIPGGDFHCCFLKLHSIVV
jgi:hypothetical protein